jgi:hypothetical protein
MKPLVLGSKTSPVTMNAIDNSLVWLVLPVEDIFNLVLVLWV